jgi:hypothetical protein
MNRSTRESAKAMTFSESLPVWFPARNASRRQSRARGSGDRFHQGCVTKNEDPGQRRRIPMLAESDSVGDRPTESSTGTEMWCCTKRTAARDAGEAELLIECATIMGTRMGGTQNLTISNEAPKASKVTSPQRVKSHQVTAGLIHRSAHWHCRGFALICSVM